MRHSQCLPLWGTLAIETLSLAVIRDIISSNFKGCGWSLQSEVRRFTVRFKATLGPCSVWVLADPLPSLFCSNVSLSNSFDRLPSLLFATTYVEADADGESFWGWWKVRNKEECGRTGLRGRWPHWAL